MEMTIELMVVLFVAVVVGMAIIGFSKDQMDQAKIHFDNDADTNADLKENVFLEVKKFTVTQINSLAKECEEINSKTAVEDKTCFIIHSSEGINPEQITDYETDFEESDKTLLINYVINKGGVVITN